MKVFYFTLALHPVAAMLLTKLEHGVLDTVVAPYAAPSDVLITQGCSRLVLANSPEEVLDFVSRQLHPNFIEKHKTAWEIGAVHASAKSIIPRMLTSPEWSKVGVCVGIRIHLWTQKAGFILPPGSANLEEVGNGTLAGLTTTKMPL